MRIAFVIGFFKKEQTAWLSCATEVIYKKINMIPEA